MKGRHRSLLSAIPTTNRLESTVLLGSRINWNLFRKEASLCCCQAFIWSLPTGIKSCSIFKALNSGNNHSQQKSEKRLKKFYKSSEENLKLFLARVEWKRGKIVSDENHADDDHASSILFFPHSSTSNSVGRLRYQVQRYFVVTTTSYLQ